MKRILRGRTIRLVAAVVLVVVVLVLVLWAALWDHPPRYNVALSEQGPTIPTPIGDAPILRGMWPDRPEQDDATLVMVVPANGCTAVES